MSPSERFPLQEFVYVICTMSAFSFVQPCKCQSRLKVSAQINSPRRKNAFSFIYFPLKCLHNLLLFEEC